MADAALVTDPMGVLVVLAGVVLVSVKLEERVKAFRSLGAAFIGILLGMLLSNTGVLPGESPTYRFLMGPGVSVGIVLILLSVDVRTVLFAGPRMLAAFGIGAVGTAVGAVVGAFAVSSVVGPETWKLAGQFAGTYTGGGVNFAALGEAFRTRSDLFTAGVAADVIITAVWMAACLTAPVVFSGWRRTAGSATSGADGVGLREDVTPGDGDGGEPARPSPTSKSDTHSLERTLYASRRPVSLGDLSALAAVGIGTVWASHILGSFVPALPEVLWLTTLALLLAQIPAVRGLAGSAVAGNYLVLLFLASNGARSVVANILHVGPGVVYFAAAVVAIHGVIIFAGGWLAHLDAGTLAVASQACVGGPASAMALASARGYTEKVLPAVAVGLVGYALGNYWGWAIGQVVRGMLGG
ncbi:MAG: DUF819 family protein [Gemmatimonadetes bacterium]|nr:DUF819 family protein [Gemmatimonadota bacterium]